MLSRLGLREREKARFSFFVGMNLLMNIGLSIGQGASEGIFLSHPSLGPARLPAALMAAALFTSLATYTYSLFVDRLRNDRYFKLLQVLGGTLVLAILGAIAMGSTLGCAALLGTYYAITTVFNTHFWNYATDYFDTMESKRLFPYFPLGNSLGGFIGGLLTCALVGVGSPVLVCLLWPLTMAGTWLLITLASGRLKTWVVSEALEKDDASLEHQKQGFRYLHSTPLGKWHLYAVVSMVVSLTFLQFIYAGIITRTYPRSDELTGFIGTFLALSNLLELALGLLFTSRFIEWMGVGSANLLHPVATLVAFGACGTWGTLPAAIFGRINRETLDNAVASSCRNLLYNAYPARLRGRVRALLEGVISNAGIATGSLALFCVIGLSGPYQQAVVLSSGVLLTLLFFYAVNRLRREYLAALLSGLSHWNLDLENTVLELGHLDDTTLMSFLNGFGEQSSSEHLELALRLCRQLRKRSDLVLGLLDHPSSVVREAALSVLADLGDVRLLPHLEKLMVTGTPAARAVALQTAWKLSQDTRLLTQCFRATDAVVRATAGALAAELVDPKVAEAGQVLLREMLRAPDPESRQAAISRLPARHPWALELLLSCCGDTSAHVRRAVLQALEELDTTSWLHARSTLMRLRTDPAPEVRCAVLRLLGRMPGAESQEALVEALGDTSLLVRQQGIALLQAASHDLYPIVEPLLRSPNVHCVDAALAVLISWDTELVRRRIQEFLYRCVDEAHRSIVSQHALLPAQRDTGVELLLLALEGALLRDRTRVLVALSHLEEASVVRNITRCLSLRNRQARGEALEALSNLGDRKLMRGLVALFDDAPLEERVGFSLGWLQLEQPPAVDLVITEARLSSHVWVAKAALAASGEAEGPGGADATQPKESIAMKHLLFLKKVSLFSQLTFEQLEILARCVTEHHYLPGEVVFEQGQVGDELYIIIEGQVAIIRSRGTPTECELVRLGSTEYFGEMAVLDEEPRSASVVVTTNTQLLSLSGLRLRDIIGQRPEIAFSIFAVLSGRLRRTNEKMNELSEELKGLRVRAPAPAAH